MKTDLLTKIQDWLNEKPFTKEANISFWSGGIVIVLRSQSQVDDKIEFRIAWEAALFSNLDLIGIRIEEAIHRMGETKSDWRIGLSCKPRLRTHADYYEPPGTIIAVHPSGEGSIVDPDGVLRIQRGNKTFLSPASDWITA